MHSCVKGKELIIFDWDETLMNSREVARSASLKTISQLFGTVDLSQQFIRDVGHSPCVLPIQYFNIISSREREKFVETFVKFHREIEDVTGLVPYAKNVLLSLINLNYKLAIATGRSHLSLQALIKKNNMDGYFSAIRCKENSVQKPNAEVVNGILLELNCKRENTLLVGDSRTDLKLAMNAGIDFVHAAYNSYFNLEVPHKIYAITELIN